MKITPELVRTFLSYNKQTGHLTWKTRERKWFKTEAAWKGWNRRWANQRAFRSAPANYHIGSILGQTFLAHRVIWALVTGRWPKPGYEIDHHNTDSKDNRWKNLRELTTGKNRRNRRLSKVNSSGVTGVRQLPSGKFSSYLGHKLIGTYTTLTEARRARRRAERRLWASTHRDRAPSRRVPTRQSRSALSTRP